MSESLNFIPIVFQKAASWLGVFGQRLKKDNNRIIIMVVTFFALGLGAANFVKAVLMMESGFDHPSLNQVHPPE